MHTGSLGNLLWHASAKLGDSGWRPIAEQALFCQLNFCTPSALFRQGWASSHRTPRGWQPSVTCLSAWHVHSNAGWQAMSYAWHLPPLEPGHQQSHKRWTVPCLSKTFTLSYPITWDGGWTWHSVKFLLLLLLPHSQAPCFHVWRPGIRIFLWPEKGWHVVWAWWSARLSGAGYSPPLFNSCW